MNPTPVMQKTEDPAAGALPVNGQAAGTGSSRPGLVACTGTGPGVTGLLTLRAAELIGVGRMPSAWHHSQRSFVDLEAGERVVSDLRTRHRRVRELPVCDS